jgi:cellulose synthase/poly-beta-1,6-N-acetylglucosamine synthase-like glycosyltransferase
MDADSRLAPNCLKYLWEGLISARNIGGVMAKYTMRMPKMAGWITLTYLTIIKSLMMVYQIWTLRGRHSA